MHDISLSGSLHVGKGIFIGCPPEGELSAEVLVLRIPCVCCAKQTDFSFLKHVDSRLITG